MKRNDIKNSLQGLSGRELLVREYEFRKELFSLRLKRATGHVKDYSQFKKLRKNIARAQTLLRKSTVERG